MGALLRAVHTPGSAPPSGTAHSVPTEYCHLPGKSPWEQYQRVASIYHKKAEKTLEDLSKEERKYRKAYFNERARAGGLNRQTDIQTAMMKDLRTQLQEIADDDIAIANGEYSRAEFEEQLVSKTEELEAKLQRTKERRAHCIEESVIRTIEQKGAFAKANFDRLIYQKYSNRKKKEVVVLAEELKRSKELVANLQQQLQREQENMQEQQENADDERQMAASTEQNLAEKVRLLEHDRRIQFLESEAE